jgi:hypothetical protein
VAGTVLAYQAKQMCSLQQCRNTQHKVTGLQWSHNGSRLANSEAVEKQTKGRESHEQMGSQQWRHASHNTDYNNSAGQCKPSDAAALSKTCRCESHVVVVLAITGPSMHHTIGNATNAILEG